MATKRENGNAKKSNTTLFVLLGGGIVVAILGCCGLTSVLAFVFWPRSEGPGGGDKGPVTIKTIGKVGISKDNWKKIDVGLTRPEIEAILGGSGEKIAGPDANNLVTRGLNLKPIPANLLNRPDTSFAVWRKNDDHVLVGFFTSQKYGDLSTYAHLRLNEADGKMDTKTKFSLPAAAEGTREQIDKKRKFFADPKWKKGSAVRKAIVGSWGSGSTVHFEFNADGTLRALVGGPNVTVVMVPGTYKFVDDDHIELRYPETANGKTTEVRERRILVADDEINLIVSNPSDDGTWDMGQRMQHRRIAEAKKLRACKKNTDRCIFWRKTISEPECLVSCLVGS